MWREVNEWEWCGGKAKVHFDDALVCCFIQWIQLCCHQKVVAINLLLTLRAE